MRFRPRYVESAMLEPIVMCFSGGKDSLLALRELRRRGEFRVVALLTTVTDVYDRVSMHGVRRSLLRAQAESLGLPLVEVAVPRQSSNEIYECEMGRAFARFYAEGIRRVAFGDLFLEDLRVYREKQLAAANLECVFPLWKADSADLARRFVADGFKAVLVCVNPQRLEASFAGREFDRSLLADLPASVDPCGENGEFHTFVYEAPIFREPIPIGTGEVVERSGFVYCDVDFAAALRGRSSNGGA
jgi:uncharacterized protein (TIGR00290 family)